MSSTDNLETSSDKSAAEPQPNLGTEAYRYLLHRLRNGSIRPGERLVEADIASHLGVSRVPVRQALMRLVVEGYLVSTPRGYEVNPALAGITCKDCYQVFDSPLDACRGADLVTTDVWTSMGYEAENEVRRAAFAQWCVDEAMMAVAKPQALFMHCLPAHRGEEVSAEVIDGPQSVVWDEAENRMHVQKALMEYLLLGKLA